MKIEQLLEMPVLRKTELPPREARPFFSEASLARNYEFIHRSTTHNGTDYWVVIKKDRTIAAIGFPGQRDDGTFGMDVIGTLEFRPPTISSKRVLSVPDSALQVGLAHVVPRHQGLGWGLYLYTALADAGYVIISDNLQYLGGQAIWKRIAKQTMVGGYQVFVVDDGEIRVDADGNPLVYDGSNIDDSGIWSEDAVKKYALFILKAL